MSQSKYLASMIGGALGDAMGRPTEFDRRLNAGRDDIDLPRPALITDDTQMSLATAQALLDHPGDEEATKTAFLQRYIEWMDEDDLEGRAPGRTCLMALTEAKKTKSLVAMNSSKGCGSIMRTHPIAFVDDPDLRQRLAAAAALTTHAHPTSTASSVVWTEVVAAAAAGAGPERWMDAAWDAVEAALAAGIFPAPGYAETRHALALSELAIMQWDDRDDPCEITGDGWVAEQAMATSLLVAIKYADDPQQAIKRAARSKGDSDSLASMVGALLGAYHGMGAWPQDWVDAIEQPYLDRIRTLAGA